LKLRIRFEKYGVMKFIGHLDTQRYFQKVLRRAGLPLAYTEGFSPHQKLSFAQPLGVGVESRGEYFDIEMREEGFDKFTSESVIESLNENNAEGILVTDCVRLKDDAGNAMASVFAADYELRLKEGCFCPFDMKEATDSFNSAKSYIIIKETKKTRRELDLKELVYFLDMDRDCIRIRLNAASGSSVKPMLLIRDLYEKRGFELNDFDYGIMRLEILDADFNPLIEAGERF